MEMHMCGKLDEAVDLALMEPVLEKYSSRKGTLIPVLQQAQALYGYLPRPVLNLISRRLRVPMSKIYGVATFYSQFYLERRGKHVLKVCDGTACHVKGTPALLNAVRERYDIKPGQTTEDYELTLEVVYCIGSCALAPVAVLDTQVMGQVRREKLLTQISNRTDNPAVEQ
jgi:NADH-quinone oxidoreductase subunit E